MRLQHQWWSVLVAAGLVGLVGVTAVAAAGEQFLPVLSMREGAFRFVQIPQANGYIDYLTLLNARDGGINGVPLVWEECETVNDATRGIRDKMVGHLAACAEPEMARAGEAAIGFICASWFGTGRHFPLIQDILTSVYARGKGAGPESDVGTSPWIRGVLRGVLTAEALRTARREFGHQPLTGAQVQWGLEHLSLTAASLKELGAEGLISPLTLSCRDHEGGGGIKFQQWDGTQWTVITDWIAPDQALVRPLVEASAAKYAQDKGITPRACP